MANYRKSFNFRSGVQVDNDRFIVDGRGNVGVGTSAPNRILDVYGAARFDGTTELNRIQTSGVSTFTALVNIGSSVFLNPSTGIISAYSYRGDGRLLDGVIAIATDGWKVKAGTLSTTFNVYVGLGSDIAQTRFQVGLASSTFVVTDNGTVGIGTINPISKLDIIGNQYISGSVGIGTTNPTTNLQVNGGALVTGISTLGVTSVTNLTAQQLILSGISTHNNTAFFIPTSTGVAGLFSGTTSSDMLRITQLGTGNAFKVEDETNPDTTPFVIDANGYIGIGTDTINSTQGSITRLNIHADSSYGGLRITNPVDGSGLLRGLLLYYDGSLSSYSLSSLDRQIRIQTSSSTESVILQPSSSPNRRVGIGSTLPINKLDIIGNTYISGNLGIGITNPTQSLRVDSGSSSFVVTSTGSVGIGTTNPTSKFYVVEDGYFTGVVTATTFIGDLTGTATNATNLSDGANITTGTINDARLPDLITSNISASTGISTVTKLRSETIGVGTDSFTSDLAIIKDASVSLELISRTGNTTIGLGSETIGNNNTARIRYTPLSQVLDFENYGSGEVNFHVHKGTGAVVGTQTGGFYFKTGSASKTLMNLAYDGRVSINEEVPLLTDLGYSLMVNGNTKIRGRLDLNQGINAGIVTVSSLNSQSSSTFPTTQNFNTQSGISTFNQFRVTNLLNVTGVSSFSGITTFLSGVSIGSSTVATNSPLNIYSTATLTNSTLGLSTTKIHYDYVGGITTGFSDPRNQTKLSGLIADPSKKISAFGYGDYQVRTGGLSIICQDYINIHPSLAVTTTGVWEGLSVAENSDMGLKYANGVNLPMIGINTTFARSIVDVGYAVTSMNSYFIPPRLSTTDIYYVSQLWNPAVAGPTAGDWYNHARANSSTPYGVISGAIVFDTTASQLKVGIGSTTFCGIATFTNNHSGFSAFIPPTMTTSQRNTMTNAGISSGAIIYNSTSDRLEVRLKGAWWGITTAV